jgi:hypothetical protein
MVYDVEWRNGSWQPLRDNDGGIATTTAPWPPHALAELIVTTHFRKRGTYVILFIELDLTFKI